MIICMILSKTEKAKKSMSIKLKKINTPGLKMKLNSNRTTQEGSTGGLMTKDIKMAGQWKMNLTMIIMEKLTPYLPFRKTELIILTQKNMKGTWYRQDFSLNMIKIISFCTLLRRNLRLEIKNTFKELTILLHSETSLLVNSASIPTQMFNLLNLTRFL